MDTIVPSSPANSSGREIVCVYGALRSGTTLLRLMLDSHPSLICSGETDFLFDHIEIDPSTEELIYDLGALARDRIFRLSGLALPSRKEASRALPELITGLRKKRRGTIILMNHRRPEMILRLLPKMKIIHIVRDPRDVARSSIGMLWAGNVFVGVDHWVATECAWDRVACRLDSLRVFTLQYERLVAQPGNTLKDLCRFLGKEFDETMLSYDASSSYDKPDMAKIEQWRHQLTPYEIGLLEEKIGHLLEERGYARSGHLPVVPSALFRAMLIARSKLSVKRRTIARYGLRDVTMLLVGRWLNISALRHRAERNIDKKTIGFLK